MLGKLFYYINEDYAQVLATLKRKHFIGENLLQKILSSSQTVPPSQHIPTKGSWYKTITETFQPAQMGSHYYSITLVLKFTKTAV